MSFHGIKTMGEPPQSFDRPVVVEPLEQMAVAGVMGHLQVCRSVKQGIETFIVSLVVCDQDPPQQRVKGCGHSQQFVVRNALLLKGTARHLFDIEFGPHPPIR